MSSCSEKLFRGLYYRCALLALVIIIDTNKDSSVEGSPLCRYRVLVLWRPSSEASPKQHPVQLGRFSVTAGAGRILHTPHLTKGNPPDRSPSAQELPARSALESHRKDYTPGGYPALRVCGGVPDGKIHVCGEFHRSGRGHPPVCPAPPNAPGIPGVNAPGFEQYPQKLQIPSEGKGVTVTTTVI